MKQIHPNAWNPRRLAGDVFGDGISIARSPRDAEGQHAHAAGARAEQVRTGGNADAVAAVSLFFDAEQHVAFRRIAVAGQGRR